MKIGHGVHVAGAEEEIVEALALVEAVVVAVQLKRAQEPSPFSTRRRRRRLGLLLLLLHLDPRRGAEALVARRVVRRDRSRRRRRRRRRRVPAGGRGRRQRAGALLGWLPGEPLDELAEVPGLRLDDVRRQDVDDPDLPRRRLRDGVGEPPVRGRLR